MHRHVVTLSVLMLLSACSGASSPKKLSSADAGKIDSIGKLDAGKTQSSGNSDSGSGMSIDKPTKKPDAGPKACTADGDCDDKLLCSGTEVCDAGTCKHTNVPCKGQLCDESMKAACSDPVMVDAVTLDPSTKMQTIIGWEATAQTGQDDVPRASYDAYIDELMDAAVNDLGLTRLRVELRSGAESTAGGGTYPIVNDNADPNVIDPKGFDFSVLDKQIDLIVLPMKKRVEQNGEKFFFNLNYVSFLDKPTVTPSLHAEQPEEYAEFVFATYKHVKDKYGIDIDAWEPILEPDNVQAWTAQRLGAAIAAAATRLKKEGFTPHFIAPSCTDMGHAITYYDTMIQVPGVLPYLLELSYHRYGGVSDQNLMAIQMRSQRDKIGSSMLEHIGSDYTDLHKDLALAWNTSWQQFTLAFPAKMDGGGTYFSVVNPTSAHPQIQILSRTKLLRQYFKFVRPGAVRMGAMSSVPKFEPLAFTNTSGKVVVVVKSNAAGGFSIAGLPDGKYGIKYTTQTEYDIDAPDAYAYGGQLLVARIPEAGVITIYGK
jgi:O-glycosyl hydrolase